MLVRGFANDVANLIDMHKEGGGGEMEAQLGTSLTVDLCMQC